MYTLLTITSTQSTLTRLRSSSSVVPWHYDCRTMPSSAALLPTHSVVRSPCRGIKIKFLSYDFLLVLLKDCVICPLYVLNHLMIYFVPLPFPSTAITPFFSIAFSNCVVFDLPNGTYGAISLIGFSIVLLKNL